MADPRAKRQARVCVSRVREELELQSGKPVEIQAMTMSADEFTAIWGAYPNYDDIARFEYGRRMWARPAMRARLLAHWLDPRHPYRDRFTERRPVIEYVRGSAENASALQRRLLADGTSLRCVARKIPPVFGDFFDESRR